MKRKAQVRLLPTNKASKIHKLLHYNDELRVVGDHYKYDLNNEQPQNLYFIVQEILKAEDYSISKEYGILQAMEQHYLEDILRDKIVATTDPELHPYNRSTTWEYDDYEFNDGMGIIGDDFIEAYIKAHNEGNPITEVMLEYDYTHTLDDFNEHPLDEPNPIILKLRQNGTVIISPVKEKMYSRNELKNIAANAHSHGYSLCLGSSNDLLEFPEWFDKNYPE